MDLTVRLDDAALRDAVQSLAGNDVRTAAVWALNDTAADVLTHVNDRMSVVFDRPTPFTQRAFMVVKARADTLEATVQERPGPASRQYLKVQEEGGARRQTGFESLIAQKLAFSGVVQSIIPADNARLDAYGNWSMGERNQVLSALGAQRDAAANTTVASRKRNAKRANYFVPKSGLTPAIYKRDASGQIGIVAVISPAVPVYQQRLGFFDGAGEVYAAKLPDHLGRTIAKMFGKRFR